MFCNSCFSVAIIEVCIFYGIVLVNIYFYKSCLFTFPGAPSVP